jgi:prolipoprotein diacylglyceryltransferase
MPQVVNVLGQSINSLTVLVACAFCVGIAHSLWHGQTVSQALLALALHSLCAVVLARVLYVAVEWSYFAAEPGQVVALRATPGLLLQGAAIGWLVAGLIARRARLPQPSSAVPGLIVAASALGCIANGCLYGREVFWPEALWFLRVDWPDAYLIRNPRLPLQLLQAAGAGLSLSAYTRWFRSALAQIWLLALIDVLLQFGRGDFQLIFGPLRLEQWIDVAILCAPLLIKLPGFSEAASSDMSVSA